MSMRVKCACGEWVELHENGETRCGVCGRTVDAHAELHATGATVNGAPSGSGRLRIIIAVLFVITLALVVAALTKRAGRPDGDELDVITWEAPAGGPAKTPEAPGSDAKAPSKVDNKAPRTVPTVLRGNDGVTIRKPKDGAPVELVVDPFPEDLKPATDEEKK